MGSSGLFLFSFSSVFLINLSSALGPEFRSKCSSNGNSTANRAYEANLDYLVSHISSYQDFNHGFYNMSVGQTPDRINAIGLCRGDQKEDDCRSCLNETISALRENCLYDKEAIGWAELCTLRYSNREIFGVMETDPVNFLYSGEASNIGAFNQSLSFLLNNLSNRATTGSSFLKYAADSTPGPSYEMIYALVQCTPDLSQQDCSDCLAKDMERMETYCLKKNATGCRIGQPSCNLRYETYQFFKAGDVITPPSSPPSSQPSSPPSSPPPTPIEGNGKNTTRTIIFAGVASIVGILFLNLCIWIFLRCRKSKDSVERGGTSEEISLRNSQDPNQRHIVEAGINEADDEEHREEMHYFSLAYLKAATNNFSDANKLGEGGFGPVYKGVHNGKEVAVKRLSMTSSQGLQEFKNEVKLIIKLQHKNLVRFLGYCLEEDEKLLVYEYMANKSLDGFLFDSTKCKLLHWETRANIINGIAKGLQYLHEDSRLKIIHRDLKASNVLLDDEMNPKISDFGTARNFGVKQMEANTERIVGTSGYMAPEYALEGQLSVKSDVYSFGILLLEIISGKRNRGLYTSDCVRSLQTYAWMLWSEGKAVELIDPNIVNNCPQQDVLRWIQIALLCVQDDPAHRPTMSLVVIMLGSNSVDLPQPSVAPYSAMRFLTSSDYSSTSGGNMESHESGQSSTNNTA